MLKKVEVKKVISGLVHEKVNAITSKVSPDTLVDEMLEEAKRLCSGVDLIRGLLVSPTGRRPHATPRQPKSLAVPGGRTDF